MDAVCGEVLIIWRFGILCGCSRCDRVLIIQLSPFIIALSLFADPGGAASLLRAPRYGGHAGKIGDEESAIIFMHPAAHGAAISVRLFCRAAP